MSPRSLVRGGLVAAFAALALLALGSGVAVAKQVRPLQGPFGSAEQPTVTNVRGMAVDQATGDVLVTVEGTVPELMRFKPDGTPADFSALGTNVIDGVGDGKCVVGAGDCDETPENGIGFSGASEAEIAVDNSGGITNGDIYVTQGSPNVVNIFSSAGAYLGRLTASGSQPFSEACGVTVDPSGDVYVGDYQTGIHKFVPTANPPLNSDHTADFSTVPGVCTLAAGVGPTEGFIFAATFLGPTYKVNSTNGTVAYKVDSASTETVGVDPTSGHLFVADSEGVEEFDASGATAPVPASVLTERLVNAIGVPAGAGSVYVGSEAESAIQVFGPPVTLPEAKTGTAVGGAIGEATFSGTVEPGGEALTECRFEYGETSSYGQSVPCDKTPAEIGSGSGAVAVHAIVTGLAVQVTYHYRIVAVNPHGTVVGEAKTVIFEPPVITAQWASEVGVSEARLNATIVPEGYPTTARIEWGLGTSYGNVIGPIQVGSDSEPHIIRHLLTGLQPGTEYHYRFVAENLVSQSGPGPTVGPDRTFTTLSSGGPVPLPDGRAYELVSPADKGGGDVGGPDGFAGNLTSANPQSAGDGDAITWVSMNSFGDAESAKAATQYLSTRGAEGWSTRSISPPVGVSTLTEIGVKPYLWFSSDLGAGVLQSTSTKISATAPSGFDNLFQRSLAAGAGYQLINPTVPPGSTTEGFLPRFGGASADGGKVAIEVHGKITPEAPEGIRSVYEWISGGGLKLASVFPEGVEAEGAGSGDGEESQIADVVSADGSRIFWTSNSGQLYVREDGVRTIKLNVSQRAESTPSAGAALFRGATPDGSRAFFTDGTALTESPEDHGGLYEYDFADHRLTLLTPCPTRPEVQGVPGISEDGESLYFVALAQLAPGATLFGNNLYHEVGGQISFVAELKNEDNSDWSQGLESRTAEATPDGSHLAFTSTRPLTGYDNDDAATGQPDSEVFLYDAATGRIECASCDPSGQRPTGPSTLPREAESTYQPHFLSDDGRELFFDSEAGLVPTDTNGREDVYEFENGAIYTISPGTSEAPSYFSDASADGDDAFFVTRSRLVTADQDENVDLYDARVGGGLPEDATSAPCAGESCRGPLGATPAAAPIQTSDTAAAPGDSAKATKKGSAKKGSSKKGAVNAKKANRRVCKAKAKRHRAHCPAKLRKRRHR